MVEAIMGLNRAVIRCKRRTEFSIPFNSQQQQHIQSFKKFFLIKNFYLTQNLFRLFWGFGVAVFDRRHERHLFNILKEKAILDTFLVKLMFHLAR